MKKVISFFLTFALCITLASNTYAQDNTISVILNGRLISMKVAPQIIGEKTFIPLRDIFEKLGAEVTYHVKSKTITAVKKNKNITMQVESNKINVDGKIFSMDAMPVIINSHVLIPVSAVEKSFNVSVEWNDVLRKIIIFDWSTITNNVITYNSSNGIPDFGKYCGINAKEKSEVKSSDKKYSACYLYPKNLGNHISNIMFDYMNVLNKNGFEAGESPTSSMMNYEKKDVNYIMQISFPSLPSIHSNFDFYLKDGCIEVDISAESPRLLSSN